ncbi:MAG: transposase [Chloroflexi bacterium]|nr:MAG: transposase [Chloroflexota bacterium]
MSRTDNPYLGQLQARYRKAIKKEKSAILDEFVKTTGYHRKHAMAVLNGRRERVRGPIRRPRRAQYGAEEAEALAILAALFDDICSKRLRAAMDVELPRLYRADLLRISSVCYERLLRVSPATMDRLRARHRPRSGQRRGFTKPGTLLKQRIPVRTWADWTEDRPGFCEIDLVDHSGGQITRGREHAWTLCFTDVKTGWTECVAVRNKAQVHVFAAIRRARQRLPFPLLGIDSDSGSEFINDQLYRYCLKEQITFTRGRAGRKNDNAYVEQKNWSVVRRAVGYGRYDSPEQLALLDALYTQLRLYVNFFLPVMKLKEKERLGSKVKRLYDDPQTPYARLLASDDISEEDKAELKEAYGYLDLLALRRRIDDLQEELLRTLSTS